MSRKLRRTLGKAASAPSQTASTDLQALLAEALGHHQAGRLPQAEAGYRQILAIQPRHAGALHLLGVIALQVGRHDLAADLIGQAIAIDGSVAVYHSNLAVALKDLGRAEEAVAAGQAALALNPNYAEAHSNLAAALMNLERFEEAALACRAAIRLKPDYAEAQANLGAALKELGLLDQALDAGTAAIRLNPDHAEARFNLANALKALDRAEDAVAAYQAALHLRPNHAQALYNLANTLKGLGRLDEAVAAYRGAVSARPDYAEAHTNLGGALMDLGRPEQAIAAHQAATRLKPDHAEAHYNLAFAHFRLGDLAAGWREYEWRWRVSRMPPPRDFAPPQWRGEDIAGKTILLHIEQGMGDALQFSRYAALVAARGARVVLEAPRHLLQLLSRLEGVDQLVALGALLPDFDYHCPLMSLPGVFGTTVETVPAKVPYLEADSDLVERWRARIGPQGFKIGIVWQGNPQGPAEQGRSAPLAAFALLATVPGVRLISLQKVHGLDQLDGLPPGMVVETLGDDFDAGPDAFIDTAAAMMSLDLIVTVDTAIGHLAGALGRRCWLALQKVPHWVWMMDRPDSPWYPAHRLFRQTERGDWDGVFARMAAELQGQVGSDPFAKALEHHRAGRFAEADQLCHQILQANPRHADALHLLGVGAQQLGRNDEAVDLIGQAIAIDGSAAVYHANLVVALIALGRFEEAVAAADTALRLDPGHVDVHSCRGNALMALGRLDEAVAACETAIGLQPDHADAYCNLGAALWGQGRGDEAIAALRAAIGLRPDHGQAHINLTSILVTLGRLDEAVAAGEGALRVVPDNALVHYNQAFALFMLGDLRAASREYEWRWRTSNVHLQPRGFAQPQWCGEDIAGKTILLHAEQGMGDAIQFCRYAALVAGRGARVVLEARPALRRLLSGLEGVDQFVAEGDPLPAFDVHCPLMSLPGVFGTTVETIPAEVPYLQAEDSAVERWRRRIGPPGFRIGVVWQGDPASPVEGGRSPPLAMFAPLAAVPGVRLISLQKRHGLDQLDRLPEGMIVETLGEDFDEGPDAFIDAAAAIMNLDLVVTGCTAIAHLAGALGRPVWLALQKVPHWVWMMDRQDTPWYPSMRLFRQSERGDWPGVFAHMEEELRRMVPGRSSQTLTVPVAHGELIDKITILEIKRARIADPARLANVEHEYRLLTALWDAAAPDDAELARLRAELQAVNEVLWQIEDDIRDHERQGDFGPGFVELARGVYHNNDRRAALKRQVNQWFGSAIVEEKSYTDYTAG